MPSSHVCLLSEGEWHTLYRLELYSKGTTLFHFVYRTIKFFSASSCRFIHFFADDSSFPKMRAEKVCLLCLEYLTLLLLYFSRILYSCIYTLLCQHSYKLLQKIFFRSLVMISARLWWCSPISAHRSF